MGRRPRSRTFKNDPRLSDKEIGHYRAWVDGGAPKGDDQDMPKMPEFAEGWTIGKPDAVFAMAEAVSHSGERRGRVPVLRIPVNLPEDQWIAGDRDQAGRPRAGASRDRLHAAQWASRSARPACSGRQHRRRDAEQARDGHPGGRPPAARKAPTSSCRCTTRPTARRRSTRRRSALIFAKQPPAKVAARRPGDSTRASSSRRTRQLRSARPERADGATRSSRR